MKWFLWLLAAIAAVAGAVFLTMWLMAKKAASAVKQEADRRTDPAGTDQVGTRRPGDATTGKPTRTGVPLLLKRAGRSAVENLVDDAEKTFAEKLRDEASSYLA